MKVTTAKWWLAECQWVRPLLQKNEEGKMEKITRLDIVICILWVIALVLLCSWDWQQ